MNRQQRRAVNQSYSKELKKLESRKSNLSGKHDVSFDEKYVKKSYLFGGLVFVQQGLVILPTKSITLFGKVRVSWDWATLLLSFWGHGVRFHLSKRRSTIKVNESFTINLF